MAVSVKGKKVSWGIPSTAKTVSDALVAGLVDDVKIQRGGNTSDVIDEDGDIVCRVDHGFKNTVTLTTRVTATAPSLPVKGVGVTFAAAIDGVALNTGRAFVESSEITHKGNDSSVVNITIHHYPDMGDDDPA